MAEVLRGKLRGKRVELSQWCNDWLQVIAPDGEIKIVSPLSVRLIPEEVAQVRESESGGHCGLMFVWFDLRDDGTFQKRDAGGSNGLT